MRGMNARVWGSQNAVHGDLHTDPEYLAVQGKNLEIQFFGSRFHRRSCTVTFALMLNP
jgi:hypothetical protein